ncbi:hypothetical protein NQ910_12340 [Acinetobacter baumannii]|nr:hypothetical protein [Acinetobacter baumannii]MDC5296181.1 hypothetical protein [Acinetobacter baumannii]
MKNKQNLAVTLTIIYLGLLALCIAFYALIQMYVQDKSTATNLMIWSATLFAPIGAYFVLIQWKEQKKMEELSIIAKSLYKEFNSNFSRIHTINGIVWDLLEKDEFTINLVQEMTEEELEELFEIKAEDELWEFSQIIDDPELAEDIRNFIGSTGGLMGVFLIFKKDLYSKYSLVTIEYNQDILERFKKIRDRIKSISYFI